MKIAIIGVGNLGYSIALGIVGQSDIDVESLYLSKRNTSTLSLFEHIPNVTITSDNLEAVKNSNVIILAVQPGQFDNVVESIKPVLDPKQHCIVSAVTGRNIEHIENLIGKEYPIIRSMPNTAISVSQSMTCLSANKLGQENINCGKQIFNSLGKTLYIEEDLMQAATVICASGIAFWMRLIRATSQGAVQLGFDAAEAQELAMQTALGAASLLVKSETSHPEQEIDKVTTPMGCTISGLNEMEHQGMSSALIRGLVKSYEKINEIKN
ncbi:pyrroline-5-carboxylate reductase [Urechidicola vernalis]|uniref:Pyrroline-5-carboxylate reductase n=1 Tax=Urechidicola vernalis TaxID=3075600 RepID=A0ABU2Y3U5_9FLAO|nr:pyrroline-5-carboxylate reductase [Urechidicola sp. P050]MDT0552879.1 pyrroline-5-carboxylate reductase [Urechidicola sp. P050]